jgi:hypothetical protein
MHNKEPQFWDFIFHFSFFSWQEKMIVTYFVVTNLPTYVEGNEL